ncbi:NUDIX domain-containing protein [Georgenia subflava]|uniref:NUDIX domain-containing protein n=1 Tax=Georgenia subflava TaxID=1622177 RepID=A0A6N7EFT2_9MICO|nr:NUDIX hydrolase [Georgenia subflava]MPV35808.1 NUDIX domain-containing protein [Georgenia subflava]
MTPQDVRDASREVVASTRLHEGRVFDLVADEVRLDPGDGAPVVREYLAHPGAVAILAMRGEPGAEEVLLIQQYRHPVRALLWEIPAGLLDVAGEDYEAAAARELYEEADLRAARWDVLVDYFTTPGGSSESLRVYLARDLTDVGDDERHAREDEERDMPLVWVPLGEAVTAVHAGRIHNPSAVVGILAAASARAQDWAPLRAVGSDWLR